MNTPYGVGSISSIYHFTAARPKTVAVIVAAALILFAAPPKPASVTVPLVTVVNMNALKPPVSVVSARTKGRAVIASVIDIKLRQRRLRNRENEKIVSRLY